MQSYITAFKKELGRLKTHGDADHLEVFIERI